MTGAVRRNQREIQRWVLTAIYLGDPGREMRGSRFSPTVTDAAHRRTQSYPSQSLAHLVLARTWNCWPDCTVRLYDRAELFFQESWLAWLKPTLAHIRLNLTSLFMWNHFTKVIFYSRTLLVSLTFKGIHLSKLPVLVVFVYLRLHSTSSSAAPSSSLPGQFDIVDTDSNPDDKLWTPDSG